MKSEAIMAGIFLAGNAVDCAVTESAMRHGLPELNPLIAGTAALWFYPVVKMGGAALLVFAILFLFRQHGRIRRTGLLAACLLAVAVAVYQTAGWISFLKK